MEQGSPSLLGHQCRLRWKTPGRLGVQKLQWVGTSWMREISWVLTQPWLS